MRRVYVDRNNKLGDPDLVATGGDEFAQPPGGQQQARRSRFRRQSGRRPARPGLRGAAARGIDPVRATPSATLAPPVPAQEGNNTTHYNVLDAKGNAVAVTYTLNGWYGVDHVAGRTGILMNNEMDDFTSKAGAPTSSGWCKVPPMRSRRARRRSVR